VCAGLQARERGRGKLDLVQPHLAFLHGNRASQRTVAGAKLRGAGPRIQHDKRKRVHQAQPAHFTRRHLGRLHLPLVGGVLETPDAQP
jgi:hypothetical protein